MLTLDDKGGRGGGLDPPSFLADIIFNSPLTPFNFSCLKRLLYSAKLKYGNSAKI